MKNVEILPYLITAIIGTIMLLLAGMYRPMRVRMTRRSRQGFKPLVLYPLFIGALGLLLVSPALLHLPSIAFSVTYPLAGLLVGLLAGALYVLGYEGRAPYRVEALLILPLWGGSLAVVFAHVAAIVLPA